MSHIVTWWFRRSPLESAGIKENKVDCSPEKGVRWSPPESTGLEWELIPRYKLPYLGGAPLTYIIIIFKFIYLLNCLYLINYI